MPQLPPATAEYQTVMHAPPGKPPEVRKWKMFRSSQGAMHLDFGKTAMITKPGAKDTIMLDHVKKEAHVVPAPALPKAPPPPSAKPPGAMPKPPAPPAPPQVKDLGKRMIGGHEAEGKMYTFQPPKAPKLPAPPAVKPPAMPTKPPVPAKPAAPTAPPASAPKAQTLEVWTHSKLKVPLLTKATGMPGLNSSVCKNVKAGEPLASKFQIPPGYKMVAPKPPLAR